MKRLDRFIRAVQAFGLLTGFYLEKSFEYLLDDKHAGMAVPRVLSVVLGVLALIAAVKISEWLAEAAIERGRWLRKTILGDSYIEGVWFNNVGLDRPLYGLLRIEFREGGINVEGEQYDGSAALTATWHCEMAEFDGSTLKYAYEVIYAGEHTHEIHGISRLSFAKVSGSGIPRSYNGYFQDIGVQQKACCFTGFRVEEELLAKIDQNLEAKRQVVQTLIEKANGSTRLAPEPHAVGK